MTLLARWSAGYEVPTAIHVGRKRQLQAIAQAVWMSKGMDCKEAVSLAQTPDITRSIHLSGAVNLRHPRCLQTACASHCLR